jgi:hypothetical protein
MGGKYGLISKIKGKDIAIPVHEGSRRLKHPSFKKIGT